MRRQSIIGSAIVVAALSVIAIGASAQQAQPPAVGEMTREALEAELTAARPLVSNGGVQASRVPGCTAPENRQLDFWIGEWDVSLTGQDFVVAESSISSAAQGCLVLEHWRPFQGPHGHSISTFDQTDRKWHQEYAGGGGRRSHMVGAFADGVMRMDISGGLPPGAPANLRRRMSYQQIDANTVRQWGEVERNGNWQITFDLTYRRHPGGR